VTERRFAALRSEIVHAQQMGSDFLKWKLIGAASVASLGLGFGMPSSMALSDANLLICLIPLICAYVDLARLDLVARVVTVARFLSINGDPYEQFVNELREPRSKRNPFRFAPIAVHLSSVVMNVLICGAGACGLFRNCTDLRPWLFFISGLIGVCTTVVLWRIHNSVIRALDDYYPENWRAAEENGNG
jgi:hypothetical protein